MSYQAYKELQRRVTEISKERAELRRDNKQLSNENQILSEKINQRTQERDYWKSKYEQQKVQISEQEIKLCSLSFIASEAEEKDKSFSADFGPPNKKRKLNDGSNVSDLEISNSEYKALQQQLEKRIRINELLKQKINNIIQDKQAKINQSDKAIQCDVYAEELNEFRAIMNRGTSVLSLPNLMNESDLEDINPSESDLEETDPSEHSSDRKFINNNNDNGLFLSSVDVNYVPNESSESGTEDQSSVANSEYESTEAISDHSNNLDDDLDNLPDENDTTYNK